MARKNSRAAAGSGSIRQRKNGKWEGRISIGTNPGTGKPMRRSVYGDTQAEVRKKMTEIQSTLDNGTYQHRDKITVKEWFNTWLEEYCANSCKPLTVASYRGMIENHIIPHIGAMEVQAVRGDHIQRIYNAMTKGGASGKTVKNASAVMHKAFTVARKQGLISINPCDGATLPKVEKKDIHPLTDAEIPAFLSAIDGDSMRNAYALCLFAGLREGECIGLSWGQVDFEKRRLTINQQLQKRKDGDKGYYIAASTKSGKSRTIELPGIAVEYLRNEKAKQAERRLQAGKAWSNPDNLVFTNELGKNIAISTFYERFKAIASSIGRPDLRPHDLRHTAATVAVANGADIKSVQDMLGHATASFTLNVYAHTSEKMMKDTASRVQGYYDTLKLNG